MMVQDKIGHEAFGKYAALYSLGYLFMILTDLGINQYITKSLAEDPKALEALFPKAFAFKIVGVLVFPLFMVAIGLALQYNIEDLYFLAILSFAHGVIQIVGFFRASLQGFQYFSVDAISSNIDKVLFIIFIVVLLTLGISLESFIWARFSSIFATALILAGIMYHYKLLSFPKWNLKELKPIIRQSIPFAFMTILYSVNEKVDQIMVERIPFDGSLIDQAGIYAASYRWLDAIMMYLWTILPMFFAKFAYHKSTLADKEKLLRIGTAITAIPLLLVAGFSLFYGDKFFFIYKNSSASELENMILLFQVLALALCIHGFFAILSTFLTSNGHTNYVNRMLGVNIALNMILNGIFIPYYGALAAAFATVVSTLIMSFAYIIYIQKNNIIKLPYLTWGKLLLMGGVYIGLFYGLTHYLQLHWVINTGISAIISLFFSLIIKLIQIKELKQLK